MIAVVASVASSGLCANAAEAQLQWHLSSRPTMVIGSAYGSPETTFHEIRGAVVADDGLVVVADGGSSELRVYSPEGTFRRSFGRVGDGPREFRSIVWLRMCGGPTLVVYDSFRHRITKWNTDGSLVDDFLVEGPEREFPPYAVSCGESGGFAVVGWPDVGGARRAPGPYRPRVPIGVADERGKRERLIGEFPGSERMRTEHNDRPHPFGRSTSVGLSQGEVYVGTADSFSIQAIAPDGNRRAFGRDQSIEPLSSETRERWIDQYLERAPSEQRATLKRSLMASDRVPSVPPAYAGFQIDRLGFVWVEPYVIVESDGDVNAEWSVFDTRGEFVATVLIPSRFAPTDIGAEYLLGVSSDKVGVQRVFRYSLAR